MPYVLLFELEKWTAFIDHLGHPSTVAFSHPWLITCLLPTGILWPTQAFS